MPSCFFFFPALVMDCIFYDMMWKLKTCWEFLFLSYCYCYWILSTKGFGAIHHHMYMFVNYICTWYINVQYTLYTWMGALVDIHGDRCTNEVWTQHLMEMHQGFIHQIATTLWCKRNNLALLCSTWNHLGNSNFNKHFFQNLFKYYKWKHVFKLVLCIHI
jgi:hypothetical protein